MLVRSSPWGIQSSAAVTSKSTWGATNCGNPDAGSGWTRSPVRVIDAKYPLSDSGRNSVRSDFRKDESDLGERSSIAVLPLLLLEKAADDQGLCLGFADALVSLLGNRSGVDVLPTSAVLNHGMLSWEFGELLAFPGVVGKLVVGEDSTWNHVRSHGNPHPLDARHSLMSQSRVAAFSLGPQSM